MQGRKSVLVHAPVLRPGEGYSAPQWTVVDVSADLDGGKFPLGLDEILVSESLIPRLTHPCSKLSRPLLAFIEWEAQWMVVLLVNSC